MGSLFVVLFQPAIHDLPDFTQPTEKTEVQHLMPKGLVEPFNIRVLRGFARLDKFQFHPTSLSPIGQGHGHKFQTIIQQDLRRTSSETLA